MQKLLPSYGGWTSFRGIPIHAWTYEMFVKIGNACGGFVAVTKETTNMSDLVEARIKICCFIPTFITIFDNKGKDFTIQIVPPSTGKWLIKREVKIHGSFEREAAINFDEFNLKAEEYKFIENVAFASEIFEFKRRKN